MVEGFKVKVYQDLSTRKLLNLFHVVFLQRLSFEVPGVLVSSGHVVCGRFHVQSLSELGFEEVFVEFVPHGFSAAAFV